MLVMQGRKFREMNAMQDKMNKDALAMLG